MSQFEDDGYDIFWNNAASNLINARLRRIEKMRQVGYAEYYRFFNRISRGVKILLFRPYISFEDWKKIVDKTIEEAKTLKTV